MLDELMQHQNNLPFMQEIWQGDKEFNRMLIRVYEPADHVGFKTLFGEDEPVIIEPESDEPFAIVKERVKHYSEPETQSQLHHLEKFGWYYK